MPGDSTRGLKTPTEPKHSYSHLRLLLRDFFLGIVSRPPWISNRTGGSILLYPVRRSHIFLRFRW